MLRYIHHYARAHHLPCQRGPRTAGNHRPTDAAGKGKNLFYIVNRCGPRYRQRYLPVCRGIGGIEDPLGIISVEIPFKIFRKAVEYNILLHWLCRFSLLPDGFLAEGGIYLKQ